MKAHSTHRVRRTSTRLALVTVISILLSLTLPSVANPVNAAATANVLRGGIAINELLIDPNSSLNNFDTDGNGTPDALDEFVELYNESTAKTLELAGPR